MGINCGKKDSDSGRIDFPADPATLGQDAYQAAQRLVGFSLRPSTATTITFGQPKRDPDTGYESQTNRSWKTWGWVDLPDARGELERIHWRAVMHYTGEGRKWRASWLKIGPQESGQASAWIGELPPGGTP